MLRLVFDADLELLLHRDKTALNVTCMKPSVEGGVEGFRAGASYIFDDSDHANLPLVPGPARASFRDLRGQLRLSPSTLRARPLRPAGLRKVAQSA